MGRHTWTVRPEKRLERLTKKAKRFEEEEYKQSNVGVVGWALVVKYVDDAEVVERVKVAAVEKPLKSEVSIDEVTGVRWIVAEYRYLYPLNLQMAYQRLKATKGVVRVDAMKLVVR